MRLWWVGVIALVKGKVFSLMDDGWVYVKVLRGFGRQCGNGEADEGVFRTWVIVI
ncbi:hypothetical protein XFLM_08135 [Xylella fastidiosa subsp. fastidiosa GB514]|nr:hypothetical protein XFLM_08135 [Xylella fastidiosa subsp. fastidiosa GB514]EWG14504.1 hypothetical protein P910_002198 [Xylella fastidiosa Mul-MD]